MSKEITDLFKNTEISETQNFNSIDTLKFDFNQISHDKQESGKCFLKRPHFLKCIYEDKNQKQLIFFYSFNLCIIKN